MGFQISQTGGAGAVPRTGRAGRIPKRDFKMEAERINYVNNLCEDLAHRLAELRGYL